MGAVNESNRTVRAPNARRARSSRGFSLSERVLFETERTCNVCDRKLDREEDAETVSSGLLLFVRGDERRWEEPELCEACSSAITISAMQRWETEEEEG